jgi:predicted HTH transcriptional regulator
MDGSIVDVTYLDNEKIFDGTLPQILQKVMDYIGRNMKKIPAGEGFNAPSKWEIPEGVFTELIVNALVHRDYFIDAALPRAWYRAPTRSQSMAGY